MTDVDKVLEALKVHIKKEIVDNYFADRVYLEEDASLLEEEIAAYKRDADLAGRGFMALYQALGSPGAITAVLKILGLEEGPFSRQYQELEPPRRRELLGPFPPRGFTRAGRYLHLVWDVYDKLQQETEKLKEQYDSIITHVRLLNEDIDKFNLSYDFGLIAAQMEALEGRRESLPVSMVSGEREELSTRMRFKRRKLPPEELPEIPALPPLKKIKGRLKEILKRAM